MDGWMDIYNIPIPWEETNIRASRRSMVTLKRGAAWRKSFERLTPSQLTRWQGGRVTGVAWRTRFERLTPSQLTVIRWVDKKCSYRCRVVIPVNIEDL